MVDLDNSSVAIRDESLSPNQNCRIWTTIIEYKYLSHQQKMKNLIVPMASQLYSHRTVK